MRDKSLASHYEEFYEKASTIPQQEDEAELRLFAGLDFAELGVVTGLSRATLDREFRAARAWLLVSLA